MKIKNIIYTALLLFMINQVIHAQDFASPDSSCTVDINYLKLHCYDCPEFDSLQKCKVEDFNFLGKENNNFYYSAIILKYDSSSGIKPNKEYNERYVTIFEGNKKKVSPVYSKGGYIGLFENVSAKLISTKSGNFIHIFISNGNGGWDFGEYFHFKDGRWYKLELPEFTDSLGSIIPGKYYFCRGNVINLDKMIFEIHVYKKEDSCCCPTGGTARAYLIINENKFIITKKEYLPDLN